MKKTFTLLAATILTIASFAGIPAGRVSIASMSNANIKVTIDGNRYNTSGNDVLVDNLSFGYHNVKIYLQKRNGNSWFGNNFQQVYNGNVYVRPQYFIDIIVSRFGKVFVDELLITGNNNYNDYDDDDDHHHGNGWNNGNSNTLGNNGNWNNSGWNNTTNRAMNQNSFNQLKQTIQRESFDNTKLAIAKQVVGNNFVSTDQVRELVEMFTFENNKLDLAKYAYAFTVDRNNYFKINDCFTFSNSKNELVQYITNYR